MPSRPPYPPSNSGFGIRNFVAGSERPTQAPAPPQGLMAQSRRQAMGPDLTLPTLPPSPSPWPNHASTQGFPGGTNNALRVPGVPSPGEVFIPEPRQQIASGFDPTVMGDFTASYGGPKLNTAGALAGLRSQGQHPLIALAGMSQNQQAGEAQGFAERAGAGRDQFVESQLAPMRRMQAPIDTALAQQHPAIQGLQELESQRKALPQQVEAQGKILQAREQARGILGGAQSRAAGQQNAARIAALAPLLNQLGLAQERQQQSAVDDLDEFADPNEQAIRALQQIIAEYYQDPVFGN